MAFRIIRNDITKIKADAIVNTANPKPMIGNGTDRAIYQAAGSDDLLAERKKIGNIALGEAAYTDAFALNAKYIIHTAGPYWIDGNHHERDILKSCYENCLLLAAKLKCKSIAFPLISTGTYGFPKDEALAIALSVISQFLLSHEMDVILAVFDRKAFVLSKRLIDEIDEFIDDHYEQAVYENEYESKNERIDSSHLRDLNTIREYEDDLHQPPVFGSLQSNRSESHAETIHQSLDEFLDSDEETFQERLFELIDQSGMDDVTVYKKANIDRKLFSKIRSKKDYKPKKKTAVAFAIALELDMPALTDLLARAEIAFSPSNPFDLIITYFVTNHNYDIYEINAALFKYGQPLLGE